jgi:hypothetical protein
MKRRPIRSGGVFLCDIALFWIITDQSPHRTVPPITQPPGVADLWMPRLAQTAQAR